jgi:dCMP deaminase
VLLNARNEIIGTGYNGVAHGQQHCNTEDKLDKTYFPFMCKNALNDETNKCQAIHAEINAMLQCKDVFSIKTCVSTHRPCLSCTKALLNTSCEQIIFLIDHEDDEPKKLWESTGRLWIPIEKLNG